MSFFENPRLREYAYQVQESMSEAVTKTGIRLSPFAFDIVHTWTLALAFEGPTPTEPLSEPDPQGVEEGSTIIGRLPDLMERIASDLYLGTREPPRRNVITGADLFHWLTEHGHEELAFVRWPYPKD